MTLVYNLLVAPKLCTPTSLHSTSHQKIHALTHTHFLWRLHWKVYSNWRTKNFWLRFSLKLTRDGILENRKQGKIWQFWTLHLTCFLYYPWSEASRRGEVSQEIEVGDASGDVKLLVMANQIIFKFISNMVDFKVKEKNLVIACDKKNVKPKSCSI